MKNCIYIQTIDKITFNEIFAKFYNSNEKFIITYKDNNKSFKNKTYLYYCRKEIMELLDNKFLIEIINNHDYINYPEHFIKNFDCFKQLPNKYLINILNKINYKKISVKDLLNIYNKEYDKEIIDLIKNKIIENFEFDVKLIDILFAFHNDNNHLKDLFHNFKNKDDCYLNVFLSFCFANKKEELVKELKDEILKILHNKNVELTYLLKFSTILNNKEIDKLKHIVQTFEVTTFINICQKSDFNINNNFLDHIIENLWFTKSKKNLINNIINKDLISIDLNKANFNVFNLYGLNQELNYFTYEEFVKKYINYDYFAKSKSLRQVIFGELNASRQQTVQKQILKHFAKNLEILNLNIKMLSSDEIIIEPKNIIKDLQDVKNILLSINKNLQFYSVNHITLEKIDKNHPFFVKKTYMDNDTKIEFKGVNDIFLPQVYKKYFNLELNEFDLTFFHEGFLAQFKDKLFEPELNQKNKLKP